MKEKFLPIGSIVNVKKYNSKLMVIGYYSLEYQDSLQIYDYVGCNYPEGLLIKNNLISFNHEDIIKCDFVGYQDDSYTDLNTKLNEVNQDEDVKLSKENTNVDKQVKNIDLLEITDDSKIESDVNISSDTPKEIDVQTAAMADNYFSYTDLAIEKSDSVDKSEEVPSLFDIEEEKEPNKEEFVMPHYHFDENGIIISE